MIALTQALDLGGDRTRMKNRSDVERQTATARILLERLYAEDSAGFSELQLLADEVGMGKTFVALAVAYSVLEAQARSNAIPGAYQKVLVLVPQNEELLRKWRREVGEIVKRCALPAHRVAAERLFTPRVVERPDELVAALRCGKERVILAKTSALEARIAHDDPKLRVTLAALFRDFGPALPIDSRRLLLKGAPDWPKDPSALGQLTEAESGHLPFAPERIERAVRRAAAQELRPERDELLELCKLWAAPHTRQREVGFAEIRKRTLAFYKAAIWTMLGKDLPLVIVDEAHQWKNKRNGFAAFARRIAPRARRALLLTATPFQLHPAEILTLLEVSDSLCISEPRKKHLSQTREQVVRAALDRAQLASRAFAAKWSALGGRLEPVALRNAWESPALQAARAELERFARQPTALEDREVDQVIARVRPDVEPELREFVAGALRLFAFNRELGVELGRFVLRHRRSTEHRVVRAGQELDQPAEVLRQRPDAHVLHAAPGLEVRGDHELPLYLLMRATSELEQGKRTANPGSSLTGCYSTFFASAVSTSLDQASPSNGAAAYIRLLKEIVGDQDADRNHPKLSRVVEEVVARWERGEKSLIFTFRVNTADRLHELIGKEIQRRLEARKSAAFGDQDGFERLRDRLRRRTDALFQPMLDRVLWSVLWAPPDRGDCPIKSTDLRPQREDYEQVARLALTYGQDLLGKTVDRVFLHRAAENSLARRLIETVPPSSSRLRKFLERMAEPRWVERAYGGIDADDDAQHDDVADERGVHTAYDPVQSPTPGEVRDLTDELLARESRSYKVRQVGLVRQAFVGPSFWLGADPEQQLAAREHQPADVEVDRSDQRFLHVHLSELTFPKDTAALDFRTRALAFKAMRRALLRESILARLLPRYEDREDAQWADLLVQHFTEPAAGRKESLLRLVGVFIEDLAAASGDIGEPASARGSLYQATKLIDTVGLVKGDTPPDTRSRRFQGFNTPLLPEVLICGQIAQEGIDLHRHCSHVVHYDLAWNPATLEQRTGRIDRIGSRTQRLRQLTGEAGTDTRLEVDTPYLAGTYDERMFEELRLRAQTFEVLLGGDLSGASAPAADQSNGVEEDEGAPADVGLIPLPDVLVDGLRVDLAVWKHDQSLT